MKKLLFVALTVFLSFSVFSAEFEKLEEFKSSSLNVLAEIGDYIANEYVGGNAGAVYKVKVTEFLEQELLKWNDHSTRMKRILGIPDTTSITYLEKIKHPINLRALEQWKIERRD